MWGAASRCGRRADGHRSAEKSSANDGEAPVCVMGTGPTLLVATRSAPAALAGLAPLVAECGAGKAACSIAALHRQLSGRSFSRPVAGLRQPGARGCFTPQQQRGQGGRRGCSVTDGAVCRRGRRTLTARPLRQSSPRQDHFRFALAKHQRRRGRARLPQPFMQRCPSLRRSLRDAGSRAIERIASDPRLLEGCGHAKAPLATRASTSSQGWRSLEEEPLGPGDRE